MVGLRVPFHVLGLLWGWSQTHQENCSSPPAHRSVLQAALHPLRYTLLVLECVTQWLCYTLYVLECVTGSVTPPALHPACAGMRYTVAALHPACAGVRYRFVTDCLRYSVTYGCVTALHLLALQRYTLQCA